MSTFKKKFKKKSTLGQKEKEKWVLVCSCSFLAVKHNNLERQKSTQKIHNNQIHVNKGISRSNLFPLEKLLSREWSVVAICWGWIQWLKNSTVWLGHIVSLLGLNPRKPRSIKPSSLMLLEDHLLILLTMRHCCILLCNYLFEFKFYQILRQICVCCIVLILQMVKEKKISSS